MKYHIDKSSSKPAYLQIYNQLKKDIVNGVYPFGVKLPSKRVLSEESSVSVITSEHAYSLLCDEGYIESRQRSGYFVIYKESDFMSASENVPLFSAHSLNSHTSKGEFPFSVIAKTIRRVLLDYGERILVKSPNHGCAELRMSISAYLARSNGIKVRPEQIIIGSGAEYLYSMIVSF